MRWWVRPPLIGLLSVDLLWAFLTLFHITLDLLDLSLAVWPLGKDHKRKVETLEGKYECKKNALVSGRCVLESWFPHVLTFRGFVNNGRTTSSEIVCRSVWFVHWVPKYKNGVSNIRTECLKWFYRCRVNQLDPFLVDLNISWSWYILSVNVPA